MQKSRLVRLTFSLLALLLASGCLIESQKARDTFASGKMPKALERLANQFHELVNIVGLAEHAERESKDPTLLPIAVVDAGMDLAHRDLVYRIAFDVEQGRLAGAGYDFMGEDRWASANLINPNFFALGATTTPDGKLENVSDHPLEELVRINAEFMDHLTARIASDPILSHSLFTKINRQSFNILGAANLTTSRFFSLEGYKGRAKNGTLLDVDTRAKMASDEAYRKKITEAFGAAALVRLLDRPWEMDEETGAVLSSYSGVVGLSQLEDLNHLDVFYELVVQELKASDQKTGILAKLETFKQLAKRSAYIPPLEGQELIPVAKALYLKLYGLKSLDPIAQLSKTLSELYLDEQDPNYSRAEISSKDLNAELELNLQRYQEMVDYLDQLPKKSATLNRTVQDLKPSLGPLRELIDWYREQRNLSAHLGADPQAGSPQESLYRRYLIRTSIPYLITASNTSAHGTHTAGIVAAQDPNIRILPVRVTTQRTANHPVEWNKTKEDFKLQFKQWLQLPVVFRALGGELKDLDKSVDYADQSPANRVEVATHLLQVLGEKIDLAFEGQNALEFQFLNEVLEAIRFVGARKIKVANVSLGTSFSSIPASLSNLSDQSKMEQLFDFLKYEYFKYRLGEVILSGAPQTLFVVAAGNDGKWVDGRSRSALPMDIFSPFLAPYERDNENAPNNHIGNILAVGSIDPKDRLSSFTNILLGSKTPYILAHGESILSPVKATDMESVTQLIQGVLPALLDTDLKGQDARDALKDFYESKVTKTDSDERQLEAFKVQSVYDKSQKLLETLAKAIQLHMFLQFPNHRARMTGTSMATPAVTGMLGHMIIEKSRALGLSTREIYDRPEFAPGVLINDVFQKSKPLDGSGGRGIAMSALLHDVRTPEAAGARDVEELLKQMIKKGAGRRLSDQSVTP